MLDVLSLVPGIVWPAIPNERASQMLAVQFQLEQSQWLSPSELAVHQTRQLGPLLRHAYESVPFYRQRLDACGLHPDRIRGLTDWATIPLLSRKDIQLAGPSLHDESAGHGAMIPTVTSGSSGQPVVTMGTSATRLFYNALILRSHLWHRRDLSLKLVAIRSLKDPSAKEIGYQQWGPGTIDIVKTGPSFSIDVHAGVEDQVRALLRHDPDYLLSYPSIVEQLALFFRTSSEKLTKLREVRTFGEVLEPHIRQLCNEVFGVKVVDCYSSEELGEMAVQCPDHEHYHVHSECYLVEVLRDDGSHCKVGEVGRIVVTALHNFAMPLLRYDIGDYAEVGPPCPCGRGLPVLKRIIGRQRNMFILPDGRKVWPALELTAQEAVEAMPPIQQFQLVQRTRTSLELLIVCPRMLTEVEVQTVEAWVERAIRYKMELKITHVASISRGATGKYEDVRCDIQD